MKDASRPIAVLHVIPTIEDEDGGPGALLAAVLSVDHDVALNSTVIACQRSAARGEVAKSLSANARLQCYRPGALLGRFHGSFRMALGLFKACRDADIVVAHSAFNFPMLVSRLLCILNPWILAPHGSLSRYDLTKHRRVKLLLGPLWSALLRGAGLWYMTDMEASEAFTFGASPDYYVIPPPLMSLDLDRRESTFVPQPSDDVYDDRGCVVTYLGRWTQGKGIPRLISIFDAVAGDGDTLVLAGTGDREFASHVARCCKDARRARQIELPGWLTGREKGALLGRTDVFVLLSSGENFGMATVEAMAHGIPVLISSSVPVATAVSEAGAGLVVGADEIEAATSALEKLLSDRAFRLTAGSNARTLVQSLFSSTAVASDYRGMLTDRLLKRTTSSLQRRARAAKQ